MTFNEFNEQDNYCQCENTPQKLICDKCPCDEKLKGIMCARVLKNLAKKLISSKEKKEIILELRKFGMTSYGILGIFNGFIELPSKE